VLDQGDSHAPVPFYLSTKGYGVYVDTARYASFYVGTHSPVSGVRERVGHKQNGLPTSTGEIYEGSAFGDRVVVDIPVARGVDVYLFGGPGPLEALQRYVLFSGGGCLPPLWALGNWYRAYTGHSADEILDMVDEFERDGMPFGVIGLEPGWQSAVYPNSFQWSPRFPRPSEFADQLRERNLRLNLWENAFIHPDAPFAKEIRPHCGDELSTDGLVPDFLVPEAARIFANHHEKELVDTGAAGFKLDECDNSDFQSFAWSFPEYTLFPSGADGEQMHSLFGVHYQHALHQMFRNRNQRHFGLVRSSGALASPLPYALYSDLYNHADFLRGVANSGISGLLWTPEVRHAESLEDLVRRVQTTVLSAISMINAWYIPLPPWEQINPELNGKGVRMPEAKEAAVLVREALLLRERLTPYLYTAFARYLFDGIPPIRPMFLESPCDRRSWERDSQYFVGPSLIVAPMLADSNCRQVFLPKGNWYEFGSGQMHNGNRILELVDVPLSLIPIYVRQGSILPLAKVGSRTRCGNLIEIEAVFFGGGPCEGELYEDDGHRYVDPKGSQGAWHTLTCSNDRVLNLVTAGDTTDRIYQLPSGLVSP